MRWMVCLMLLLAACGGRERTQVVVVVEAQRQMARADELAIEVIADPFGEARVIDTEEPREASFPYTIAFSPSDGDTGTFSLRLGVLQRGREIGVARLITDYVAGETRYVRVVLEDACLHRLHCGLRATCHEGGCVSAESDETAFSARADDAPVSVERRVGDDRPVRDAGPAPAQDGGLVANAGDAGLAPAVDAGANVGGCATVGGAWVLALRYRAGTCPNTGVLETVTDFGDGSEVVDVRDDGAGDAAVAADDDCVDMSTPLDAACQGYLNIRCLGETGANATSAETVMKGPVRVTGPQTLSGTVQMDIKLGDGTSCLATYDLTGTPVRF